MNLKTLIKRFWKLNEENQFGSPTTALFFYLIYRFSLSKGKDFKLSDLELTSILKLSRNTIHQSRKILITQDFIRVILRNGVPAVYSLNETEKLQNPKKLQKEDSIEIELENSLIPDWNEFIEFVKGLDKYKPDLEERIKNKYDEWKANNWKSFNGRPIINWKTSIKNTLPFLINPISEEEKQRLLNFPKINRPNIDGINLN